jgi:hypothetical protein
MRINSLERISKVVDTVYAKLGVFDSFDSIVLFEDSLEVFHCFAPNSKMDDNSWYPDYKV